MPGLFVAVPVVAGGLALGAGCGMLAKSLMRRPRSAVHWWRPGFFAPLSIALLLVAAVRYWSEPWPAAACLRGAAVEVPLSASDIAEHRIPDRVLLPTGVLTLALLSVDAVARHDSGPFARAVICAALLAGVGGVEGAQGVRAARPVVYPLPNISGRLLISFR